MNFCKLGLNSGVWHFDPLLAIKVLEILEATINKAKLPQSQLDDDGRTHKKKAVHPLGVGS